MADTADMSVGRASDWDDLKRLQQELVSVLEGPEFRAYAGVVEAVQGAMAADLSAIQEALLPERTEVAEAEALLRLADHGERVWKVSWLATVLLTGCILWFVVGPERLLEPGGIVVAGPLAYAATRLVIETRPHVDDAVPVAARDARSRLEERRRVLVEEAVRRRINKQLEKAVDFPFSAEAPSLVELDSSRIVPAKALARVKDFVASHDASALGVAGPRGIGKSTILRALTSDTSEPFFGRALNVYITAPVRYEPVALLRHIFEEVVLAGLGAVDAARGRSLTEGHTVGRARTLIGAAMVYGGAFVYWWGRDRHLRMEPLQVAGAVVAVSGFGLALQGYLSVLGLLLRRRRRIPWSARRAESDDAIEILEDGLALLHWEVERATTNALTLKVLSGQVESGDSTTRTEREHERTRPELASAFRRLVRDYLAASKRHGHLVVCIDELDKLSDPADVIAVINELKDLMHVRGMHMVVSVSTDAMHSFALRGVPVRDVFDSTFDDVITAERLTFDESVDVLRARVAGFPRPLSAFCHAWSGGVPRDLIRAARSCHDVQRSEAWSGKLGELVTGAVERDVRAAVHAYLARSGLRARLTDRGLTEVRSLLSSVRAEGYHRLARLLVDIGTTSGAAGMELRAVARYVEIAGQVIDVFGRDLDYGEWLALDQAGTLEKGATRIADAMGSLSEMAVPA